jgi:hypothetical protein
MTAWGQTSTAGIQTIEPRVFKGLDSRSTHTALIDRKSQ